MFEYCPNCSNFLSIEDRRGTPYQICTKCQYERVRSEPLTLNTYTGDGMHKLPAAQGEADADRILENLSYEASMPEASDKKCTYKGCNGKASYMIDRTTHLFRYACSTCHRILKYT